MPSQRLVDELDLIIDRNRAHQGLSPLKPCKGLCGRRVEGDLCGSCEDAAERERIRVFLEKRNAKARERLAARSA